MKFIIFSKAPVQNFPRITSLAFASSELGFQVEIITQNIDNDVRILLESKSISIKNIENPISNNKIKKLLHWNKFAKFANNNYLKTDEKDLVWITGGDTAICMGCKILKKRNFYLQINELYDQLPYYIKKLNRISFFAEKIIVPEINRAYIFKVWFNLPQLPAVLPNKPYIISYKSSNDDLTEKLHKMTQDILEFAHERKIILYQGIIANDRKFEGVVEFVKNNHDYCLVLLGMDAGYLNEIKGDPNNIYYAGYMPAPFHLGITKLAYMCLMAYDTTSLNKVYCAPNKIWEYSKYSKPIISQRLPGIESIFNKYGFGQCCDVRDAESVAKAIKLIENNYQENCSNALNYYQGFNYIEKVKEILKDSK